MNKINLLIIGGAVTISVGLLSAQSDAEFQTYMKSAVAANTSLQKNLVAKDGPAATADAKKVEVSFKSIEEYWQKRNADDAIGFAKRAESGAASVAAAVGSGDFDGATAAAKGISATCGGCHMAHRTKTDTGYVIK